jgi:competence protein ComEA
MQRVLAIAAACAVVFGSTTASAQHAPAASTHPAAGPAAAGTAPEGVVNINAASEDELERLPGVGPSRAAAIVALRTRVQHFRSADDLLRIRGIGHVAMRRLRPYVTLAGATTLPARPGHPARQEASQHAQ